MKVTRRQLERKMQVLEECVRRSSGPHKPPFPEWLTQAWEVDGVVFDSWGRIDGQRSYLPNAGWWNAEHAARFPRRTTAQPGKPPGP